MYGRKWGSTENKEAQSIREIKLICILVSIWEKKAEKGTRTLWDFVVAYQGSSSGKDICSILLKENLLHLFSMA